MSTRSGAIEQVLTMLDHAEWLAIHERPHVRQIERIVNTRRR